MRPPSIEGPPLLPNDVTVAPNLRESHTGGERMTSLNTRFPLSGRWIAAYSPTVLGNGAADLYIKGSTAGRPSLVRKIAWRC